MENEDLEKLLEGEWTINGILKLGSIEDKYLTPLKDYLPGLFQKAYEHFLEEEDNREAKEVKLLAQQKGIKIKKLKKGKISLENELNKINQEKSINGISIQLNCSGYKNTGKFILGKNSSNEISIIFDPSCKYHIEIARKYDIRKVIGGGRLKVDLQQKKIKVSDSSGDFGYEPRIITGLAFKEAFPKYEIKIKEN